MNGRALGDPILETLRRRLRSWWGESRIRLSPADLRLPQLAAGDRLELGSRLWRVERVDVDGVEIVAVEGPPRRRRE